MSEMQDQVAAFEGAMAGVDPGDVRPLQREAEVGKAACDSTFDVPYGSLILCTLVPDHEGPHENHNERRSWARDLDVLRTPLPDTEHTVADDGGAMRAIQASRALVEQHEASGGKAIPVGENADALFGDKREPLKKIVEDVKRKAIPPTRDEIDVMLRDEQDTRAAACRKEIYAVCVKYDCQLTARPTLDPMIDGGFSIGASPIIRAL